jgi:hypothetical protein
MRNLINKWSIIILLSPFYLFGQKGSINSIKFFSDISESKLVVCNRVVNWDSNDFINISSSLNEIKNSRYIDSLGYSYDTSIKQYFNIIIQDKSFIESNNEIQMWNKSSFPFRTKLLDSVKYAKKAGKRTNYFLGGLSGYCSISKPLISEDEKYAIIKLDFDALNNDIDYFSCRYRYCFCEKVGEKWEILWSFGYYCCCIE